MTASHMGFAVAYVGALVVLGLVNRHQFRRNPEKGRRYEVLPLGYKLACWFGVVPLFVGTAFFNGGLFFVAILAYALLEGACVRWYEKAGLLR